MDHLSKQQLILLALLVSFVTSLATGIFTVSLMSQAPQGFVQTINQVVERTIQVASSPSASFGTVAIKVDDQVANAVSMVSPSMIKLTTKLTPDVVIGMGVIVSKEGILMADSSILSLIGDDLSGIMPDGSRMLFSVISQHVQDKVIFLRPEVAHPSSYSFTPITFSSNANLGQTVFALSNVSGQILSNGIITQADIPIGATSTNITSGIIGTTIDKKQVVSGSPLFAPNGEVIGMRLVNQNLESGTAFYPIGFLGMNIPTGL